MTKPASSSSGEFRLDVDLANAAIRKLEEVRDRLEVIRDDAALLARSTDETAHDPISREAFALLRRKADGEPGSLGAALSDGIEHIEVLINLINADIDEQIELDAQSARRVARS